MPVQATAHQTDPTPPIRVTEVPDSPVEVFLIFRDGEAPTDAVVRQGTPSHVAAERIAQLTTEWEATYSTPAEMEAQCLDPDNADCRCLSCGSLLAEDSVYGEPRITVADSAGVVAPFDRATAERTDGDDRPQYRYSRSGEGIDRLRSVQDERAAHARWLQDHDPVVAAGHAVEQLRNASANRNGAANGQDAAKVRQLAQWRADQAREVVLDEGVLEAVR
jgi:hypothetical protein